MSFIHRILEICQQKPGRRSNLPSFMAIQLKCMRACRDILRSISTRKHSTSFPVFSSVITNVHIALPSSEFKLFICGCTSKGRKCGSVHESYKFDTNVIPTLLASSIAFLPRQRGRWQPHPSSPFFLVVANHSFNADDDLLSAQSPLFKAVEGNPRNVGGNYACGA